MYSINYSSGNVADNEYPEYKSMNTPSGANGLAQCEVSIYPAYAHQPPCWTPKVLVYSAVQAAGNKCDTCVSAAYLAKW